MLDRRRAIWEAGFERGYVAVTDYDDPTYLQWLIPPHQNDKVRDYWGPLFPDLNGDSTLVEGAWVPVAYCKRNVMSRALALINDVVVGPPMKEFGTPLRLCKAITEEP